MYIEENAKHWLHIVCWGFHVENFTPFFKRIMYNCICCVSDPIINIAKHFLLVWYCFTVFIWWWCKRFRLSLMWFLALEWEDHQHSQSNVRDFYFVSWNLINALLPNAAYETTRVIPFTRILSVLQIFLFKVTLSAL